MSNVLLTEKYLLSVHDVMKFTGWGESYVRVMLNNPENKFTIKNGNRVFANRKLLEKYLDDVTLKKR